MAFRIPHERRDADAAREEQRRGSAFHGEAIAEGPPEVHLVAAPEFGHFFGASAGHLEKMTSSLVLTRQMENGRAQGISSAQP